MKTKNLIVICTLGIIVLLSMLIGTGIFKFSFYKGKMSNSISSSWNNSKSIGRLNDSNEEISFPTISVIVVYKKTIVGDIDSPNPIKIDISDKDFGSLWFPFIKKSSYNFSVIFKDVHEIKTEASFGQFIINGEINVSGNYKYIGSTKTVTKLVVDNVLNSIYNEIKKNLN